MGANVSTTSQMYSEITTSLTSTIVNSTQECNESDINNQQININDNLNFTGGGCIPSITANNTINETSTMSCYNSTSLSANILNSITNSLGLSSSNSASGINEALANVNVLNQQGNQATYTDITNAVNELSQCLLNAQSSQIINFSMQSRKQA